MFGLAVLKVFFCGGFLHTNSICQKTVSNQVMAAHLSGFTGICNSHAKSYFLVFYDVYLIELADKIV